MGCDEQNHAFICFKAVWVSSICHSLPWSAPCHLLQQVQVQMLKSSILQGNDRAFTISANLVLSSLFVWARLK